MRIAMEYSRMGTCHRRLVGCVLVDRNNRQVSSGMNGVPPGWAHCRYEESERCPGAASRSGTDLDQCFANHAEVNALLNCRDKDRIFTCYCTTSPCVGCVKELLHTPCRRIVFMDEYSQSMAKGLWLRGNQDRTWELLKFSDTTQQSATVTVFSHIK